MRQAIMFGLNEAGLSLARFQTLHLLDDVFGIQLLSTNSLECRSFEFEQIFVC